MLSVRRYLVPPENVFTVQMPANARLLSAKPVSADHVDPPTSIEFHLFEVLGKPIALANGSVRATR